MKKVLLLFVFVLITKVAMTQENELNVGVNGGIPIGNIEGMSKTAFGADANYLFDVFENIKFGPSLHFVYFSTKEENGTQQDPYMYLPIGGSIRFNSEGDDFFVGIDGGFAVGISPEGDRGGIFIKPMVGYNINSNIRLNVFYTGIKKRQPTYGYLGLGLSFNVLSGNNYYTY